MKEVWFRYGGNSFVIWHEDPEASERFHNAHIPDETIEAWRQEMISSEFTALTGNVTEDKELMGRLASNEYDLVLVNIVADVIIGLAPVLPNFMDKSTDLICSGILCDRLDEVVAAIRQAGLTVTSVRCGEEWRCITVKKEN